ncbi:hypothetical protein DSUL_50331 [Desulfovibrionales bacterium]
MPQDRPIFIQKIFIITIDSDNSMDTALSFPTIQRQDNARHIPQKLEYQIKYTPFAT